LPQTESWVYLVQYLSGAEGWNCIETNTVIFYSLNYSYRIMTQAAGRIDRLNTPFTNLYYYSIRSESPIDLAIAKALKNKKDFNEQKFLKGES
jgi:superfamily II DNA or RNA helicase